MIRVFLPIIILIPLFFLKSQSAVKTGSISGTVYELKSDEVVIGITISLYRDSVFADKLPWRGTYSNKFGFFSLPGIPYGEYYLVVSGVGYKKEVKRIILDTSRLSIHFRMAREDIRTQELTVTAERDITSTLTISSIDISPEFITKMPSIGGEVDVFRTLQLLPGVSQATEISTGLYIRGGSPDQNLTLLDGVIVYNPTHLGGFLSSFNTDALRDIKLIKGAFPAQYGGRLSSVIDITMKEGTKEKLKGSGGISMISSRLTLEGPINDNSSFMISGRRMYLDLLLTLAPDDGEIPRYYFYDLNAKVNYKLSDNDRIYASGYFGRDVLDPPKDIGNEFRIDWGNSTGNLRWMHIISPVLFTNFSLIYTNYNFQSAFFNEDNRNNNYKSKSQIQDLMLRAETEYHPYENHNFKAGLEVTNHQFDVTASSNFIEDVGLQMNESNIIRALDASLYLQDEWELSPWFKTNLGGRMYYFDKGNYINFEPRMSAKYNIWPNTYISGSVALTHQFLHLITRNDISLPTDLWFPSTSSVEPSRSWQGVLGFERYFAGGEYLITTEFYYKSMKNLYEFRNALELSFGIPLESQFISGDGEAYGVEFFLNKRIGKLNGWIGYTLSWTKRYFPQLNDGKFFYPRYDRRHDFKIALTYDLTKSLELGAVWVYGTGQAYTLPDGIYRERITDPSGDRYDDVKFNFTERNGARLPAYHRLDLNLMYKYKWFDLPFTLSMNIYNVYNRKNAFAWYFDQEWDWLSDNSILKLKQLTLFPLLPSLGLSFKF